MALETWSPTGNFWEPSKPSGEGWAVTGRTKVPVYSPPKAGGQRYKEVPIYTRMIPEPAPAAAPATAPAEAAAPATTAAPAETPTSTPAPPPQQKSAADALAASIATMQAGFKDQLAQQASQFAAMQKAQEDRMIALQEQMKQSAAAAAAANRPTVAGVKTATGSAGTDMQIARRGLAGAFGRAGMRIQSLNV